ncbi:uncharacterized protein LOC112001587 [Quercus suber]|uniref:uncharacterized protein LOC112001587 n=1 Tax=Quercus suber TaxID=58331 RepID=UPI000CE19877|nr:uncharacterized protein LOC112001587 [Quercus suber]
MLNGEPLLDDASIRDFQGGKASYVANTVEQALLLPRDMAELRSMRRLKVFLCQKRYLAMIMCCSSHLLSKRDGQYLPLACNAAVEAFQVAERSLQEMKKKLQWEESERKYAAAALENVEKQAESQRLQLRSVEDQLATSKTQIAALEKKLEEVKKSRASAKKAKEEAEKAKDEAEQHGYEVGVAEIEDSLRAEVLAICRTYYALTWGEALNQAGVEASSVHKRAENIYYPQAIRPSSSSDSKADLTSSEASEVQGDPPQALLAAKDSSEGTRQAEDTSKTGEANKETVQGSNLPPFALKDPSKDKETSQSMELVLATLTIPPKEGPKDKVEVSTTTESTQLPKDPIDKLVIKIKK